MQISSNTIFSFLFLLLSFSTAEAQKLEKQSFFEAADTFNTRRFWPAAAFGTAAYTGAMIGLDQIWYAEFPKSKFKFFNDWKEWEKMDKLGHSFSTYQEARSTFHILRWTGVKRRKAMWLSVGIATLFQTSLEIFDGFSEEWGFSMYDIAFNTIGAGFFVAQEVAWQEQRIAFKISNSGRAYSTVPIYSTDGLLTTTLLERDQDLYGTSAPERFIKDYNGMTMWLSVNVYSFLKNESRFPKWLNIAVGYGAENMFGGFENSWEKDGSTFVLNPLDFPRYRQFYLSPDIDFKRIKTKNKFLRAFFRVLNLVKMPAPTLEVNSLGKLKFHPIHF